MCQDNTIPSDVSDKIEQLLTLVQRYMAPSEVEQVSHALHLAQETGQRVVSEHSMPPLEQALAVATILAQMHIDVVGVTASLVFEAVDGGLLPLERVESILNPSTARIVDSMRHLNMLEHKKQSVAVDHKPSETKKPRVREAMHQAQATVVRKMFVAMAEDPRVVILKLAYRLHTMRLISGARYAVDLHEKLIMAQETREIYAPLAGRLGMSRMECELEDLAFQVLEPEKYAWVRDEVELESKQWRCYVERVCELLRQEMASIGVKAEVSGRVKHLYSFYQKLVRNAGGNVERLEDLKRATDISQIHDLIAFRILVDTDSECYIALGHIHSLWKPKEGRIKDFIANPKTNSYRALHTTVFCLDDQLVEIQIRTHAMHKIAEFGVAMHWHYKKVGDNASASAKELLAWLRRLTEWQRDMRSSQSSDIEFAEAVKGDIFQEQIFVFTPKGDVKDLPIHSTPLDFAYRIHTEVGDSCGGACITTEVGNGDGDRFVTRMVPLDYELKNGEIVNIIISRSAHPTHHWLTFARTATAKSRIRHYLKKHERDINIQIGRVGLERTLKMLGMRTIENMMEDDAEQMLCNEYEVSSFDDLLESIGIGTIRSHAVAVKLSEYWQQRTGKETKAHKGDTEPLPAVNTAKQASSARLQVDGLAGLLTSLANCCYPLPGDQILGFISRGRGVIVHRADCQNINRYREQDQERLVNVSWHSMSQPTYLAAIVVTAYDRTGLIRDIAAVISDAGVNMRAASTFTHGSSEPILVNAILEIEDTDQMNRLILRLKVDVKGVIQAERNLGKHHKR